MSSTRREVLLAAAGSLAAASPAPPGSVAFHYEAVFSPQAFDWYTRFETLVTGAFLSVQETARLRARVPRLLAYEWSSGFYPNELSATMRPWAELVMKNARSWLLSETPAGGAAAEPGRTAFWYDYGNPELRAARAGFLARALESQKYDGLFFDTVGFQQLPGAMQARFGQRHPKLDYNAAQGLFFGELRRATGNGKITFLNQGYRHAPHLLPHADMDLTESYITALDGRGTRFRPWDDAGKPWEAIRTPMEQLVLAAQKRYPKVKFVHVNYAAGDAATTRRAARYSWAISHLLGHESYTIVPGVPSQERDEIYFRRLGAARGAGYRVFGRVLWREYENGVLAVNTGAEAVRIPTTKIEVPAGPDGFVL